MRFSEAASFCRWRTLAAAVGGVAAVVTLDASAPRAQSALAPLTFTERQADSGAAFFRGYCADCHGTNLQGGDGPALFGGAFERRRTDSVGSFFNFISVNMPKDGPGSLSATQYLALVAFIARANGFTASMVPLPNDPNILEAMGFTQ